MWTKWCFYRLQTDKTIHYRPAGMNMLKTGRVEYHNADGDYTYEVFVTPLTDIYLHHYARHHPDHHPYHRAPRLCLLVSHPHHRQPAQHQRDERRFHQ